MAITVRKRSGAGQRFGVELSGPYDGRREFDLPEPVIHSVPDVPVRMYHGGRRMKYREYEIYESVPTSGVLDMVRILTFVPQPTSILFMDYTAA